LFLTRERFAVHSSWLMIGESADRFSVLQNWAITVPRLYDVYEV
jgi:hypothetical protein